jgi:hypothetical protein
MVFPLRHCANQINGRREEESLFEQNLLENLHLHVRNKRRQKIFTSMLYSLFSCIRSFTHTVNSTKSLKVNKKKKCLEPWRPVGKRLRLFYKMTGHLAISSPVGVVKSFVSRDTPENSFYVFFRV